MSISAEVVRQLREETGAGMMDCKSALVEAKGDMEKARELLRKKGLAAAAKRAGRTASEGRSAPTSTPGPRSASWSRSTARPTSWPRRPSSRPW